MTFTEKNKDLAGLTPIVNWTEFFQKEAYTDPELFNAQLAAGSWFTCMCGNQTEEIPRNSIGAPLDGIMLEMGIKFAWAIGAMREANYEADIKTLIKVKARAILIAHAIEDRAQTIVFQSNA